MSWPHLPHVSHIVAQPQGAQIEFLSDEIKPWDLYQTSNCSQAFVPGVRAFTEAEGNPWNENLKHPEMGVRS